MVDLALLQSVSYIAGALGVCVAAVYYVLVMRMTLQTRQAQLYMSLLSHWNSKEFSKMRYDSYRMDWTDLDDYTKKYNPNNNAEIYASMVTFGRSILGLAELKRKGLIDLEFLDGMMMNDTLNWWAYFGSMEKERWENGSPGWRSSVPFIMEVIEYHKKKTPFEFDENGNYKFITTGKPWVKPEEMKILQEKLNIK